MSQPTGLLCFDLDGTLVKRHGPPHTCFHPRLLEYLSELRKVGLHWAINSGRKLSSILNAAHDYVIRLRPDYIIAKESEIYRPTSTGNSLQMDYALFGSTPKGTPFELIIPHRHPIATGQLGFRFALVFSLVPRACLWEVRII